MSIHIGARPGDIAEAVLLPGDPLRARFIAESFLADPICYSSVRGMYGYTGTWQGIRVSVQGTGLGMPSFSIYATELIQEYGCRTLIRVGSCGGLQDDVKVRDLILALAASTDSAMNRPFFGDATFAPTADFGLLLRAREEAARQDLPIHVGTVLTTDTFYTPLPEPHEVWRRHRILAVEMETAALYSLAARHGCRALSILTVSDHVRSGATLPAEERERSLVQMMKLALDVATPDPLSVRRP